MVRDVTRELCGEYKWTVDALKAIHEGSETFLITILEYGNLAAIHSGRVTIMPRDIQLMMKIKELTAAYKSDQPLTGKQAQERREAKEYDGNKRNEILMELRFQRGKMIAVQSSTSQEIQVENHNLVQVVCAGKMIPTTQKVTMIPTTTQK